MAIHDDERKEIDKDNVEESEQTEKEILQELQGSAKSGGEEMDSSLVHMNSHSDQGSKKEVNFFNSYKDKNKDFKQIDKTAGEEENTFVRLRIHWIIVFIAVGLAIFLSLRNGTSMDLAFKRALYSGAAFWILAEVIDYILYKMK